MGMITEREADAEALAKVARDRIPRCEHKVIRYVGQTQMRICADCRKYMPGSDLFGKRRDGMFR